MATMNSLTDIWSVVMDSLSQELTQTAINTWFSDCTPIEINNNVRIYYINRCRICRAEDLLFLCRLWYDKKT